MTAIRVGGLLVAGPGVLAVAGSETVPWHEGWITMAIHPLDDARHLVVIGRGTEMRTSVVTVTGSRVGDATPARLLLDRLVPESSIAVAGERPLVVYAEDHQVWVASYPVRRRAVR